MTEPVISNTDQNAFASLVAIPPLSQFLFSIIPFHQESSKVLREQSLPYNFIQNHGRRSKNIKGFYTTRHRY